MGGYRGRFAPSPTGLLHAGSLVAALASWLDARAHHGTWLVRIEDVDLPRCEPGADLQILRQLADCGLHPDEPPTWQSRHGAWYAQALTQLIEQQAAYACQCSRKDIEQVWAARGVVKSRHQELVYPGTCRNGLAPGREPRAWRLRVPPADDPGKRIRFQDRWQGWVEENLADQVGDFVLKRADGFWAYQIAVVVDDADQPVTDVVRGADLLESTARQIWLQQCLGLPTPRYLHVPVVVNDRGEKLSKQTGATALDRSRPLEELMRASARLGLLLEPAGSIGEFWESAVGAWARRFGNSG